MKPFSRVIPTVVIVTTAALTVVCATDNSGDTMRGLAGPIPDEWIWPEGRADARNCRAGRDVGEAASWYRTHYRCRVSLGRPESLSPWRTCCGNTSSVSLVALVRKLSGTLVSNE